MQELYKKNTANFKRLKTDTFFADYRNIYSYSGFIDDAAKFIEDFQLLREDLWFRFVKQFREDADFDAGWRGEYWGKMMRGACFTYSYTKNENLYSILSKTVCDMIESADSFGRISSYAIEHEFDGWDIWGRKYVLLGMQYFLEICKDNMLSEKIIKSMCEQADYIISKIGKGEGKLPITKATRHWRGLNSSSLLEPIVRLYSITSCKKYLEFAEYIVSCGGTDVENVFELAYQNKFYPYQYPVTKAYEMTSCFEGLLEYYRVVGDEHYKIAVINFADKILESDFTIIGSCGCTHELFDHSTVRQANTTNGNIMQETCVTVTLMKFFYQAALLTGDSKYSDAFEISMYNAFLGAINTQKVIEPTVISEHPDWNIEPLPFDSYSPLTAGTRGNGIGGLKIMSDNHYYGCCACIGSVGIGLIPKMALLTHKSGIVINMFINGVTSTKTPLDNTLTVKSNTNYPVSGAINIELELSKPEEFEVLIRNPAWSKATEIKLNSNKCIINEGYISLKRKWISGDKIDIKLDMRTRALTPISYGSQILMNKVVWGANHMVSTFDQEDPQAKNHVAFIRGPIVLAQENRLGYSVDEPIEVETVDGYIETLIPETEIAPYPHILEMCIPLKNGEHMHVTDYSSAGKLWTEESKMAAWMLTKTNDTAPLKKDRRQRKSREAIFKAFSRLLAVKHYESITVQDIIDLADVGRSTFYAHFETKDTLLKAMCEDIFNHIINGESCEYGDGKTLNQQLAHVLWHLKEHNADVTALYKSQSKEIFEHFLREYLIKVFSLHQNEFKANVPKEFLLNHLVGSFCETVSWWVKNDMDASPEKTAEYFLAVTETH